MSFTEDAAHLRIIESSHLNKTLKVAKKTYMLLLLLGATIIITIISVQHTSYSNLLLLDIMKSPISNII